MVWGTVGAGFGIIVFAVLLIAIFREIKVVRHDLFAFDRALTQLQGLPAELEEVLSMIGQSLAPQVNLQPAPNLIESIIATFIERRFGSGGHGEEKGQENIETPKEIQGDQRS